MHRKRLTMVAIASHIKPWPESTNEERLTGENGLLLRPSIDHLFDRGFMSFEDNGELVVSEIAHELRAIFFIGKSPLWSIASPGQMIQSTLKLNP